MGNIEVEVLSREHVNGVTDLFRTGGSLIRSRILLDQLDLKAEFPLGGEESANRILQFFELAEEGYLLSTGSANINHQKVVDTFKKLESLSMQQVIQDLYDQKQSGLPQLIQAKEALNSVVSFFLIGSAIFDLSGRKYVTFSSFQTPIDELDLGDTEMDVSYWNNPTSLDEIGSRLAELHALTRTIFYQKEYAPDQKFLQAGHFFDAAFNLSHRMM